jgi:hypothetical protein
MLSYGRSVLLSNACDSLACKETGIRRARRPVITITRSMHVCDLFCECSTGLGSKSPSVVVVVVVVVGVVVVVVVLVLVLVVVLVRRPRENSTVSDSARLFQDEPASSCSPCLNVCSIELNLQHPSHTPV